MSWTRQGGPSGPRGYHHGNLKEALIRAALALIAQKGPAGVTFAEAARWAGVSPAAPYRHFRDRDELLADVARRGFEQFEDALAGAWGSGRPDVFTAFDRIGKAHLQFARSEPPYYYAMLEAGILLESSPELREAGESAFNVLRQATETTHRHHAGTKPSAGPDDGTAHLGVIARDCFAIWSRRHCRPSAADVRGRSAGGGHADLSARFRRIPCSCRKSFRGTSAILTAGEIEGM
jgi:AcrR family transcriptional regulator